MSGYLFFLSNLKDIIDHIEDYIKSCKSFFPKKSNSFKKKHELMSTPFILQ